MDGPDIRSVTTGQDGGRRTKTFPTVADAKAFLTNTQADVQRGEWVKPEGGRRLFGKYAQDVESTNAARPGSTRKHSTKSCYAHVSLPAFETRPLGSVDR